mgnify:CR=1 FL=1
MTEAQIESGRGSHSHQMTNPSSEKENIHRDLQKTSKKSRIGLKLFENEAFKVVAFSAIFCSIWRFLPKSLILCSYFLDTESCCGLRVPKTAHFDQNGPVLNRLANRQLTDKNKVGRDFGENVNSCKHLPVFCLWFSFGPFSAVRKSYGLIFLHVSDLVRYFRKSIEKHGSVTMITLIICEKVIDSSHHVKLEVISWHCDNHPTQIEVLEVLNIAIRLDDLWRNVHVVVWHLIHSPLSPGRIPLLRHIAIPELVRTAPFAGEFRIGAFERIARCTCLAPAHSAPLVHLVRFVISWLVEPWEMESVTNWDQW